MSEQPSKIQGTSRTKRTFSEFAQPALLHCVLQASDDLYCKHAEKDMMRAVHVWRTKSLRDTSFGGCSVTHIMYGAFGGCRYINAMYKTRMNDNEIEATERNGDDNWFSVY